MHLDSPVDSVEINSMLYTGSNLVTTIPSLRYSTDDWLLANVFLSSYCYMSEVDVPSYSVFFQMPTELARFYFP